MSKNYSELRKRNELLDELLRCEARGDQAGAIKVAKRIARRKKAARHYELPKSIPTPVRSIMQSWINRDEEARQ
jgi:hypothetical protein